MGTNFYIRGHRRSDEHHIGKRSAAGAYCWDCGVTLCKTGKSGVHQGCRVKGHQMFCNCGWYDACPKCGKAPATEGLDKGAAGRELGFNKSTPQEKTGVASCSSFNWAMASGDIPEKLKEAGVCPCCNREHEDKDKVIENEYGDLFTWGEFLKILEECPIQYTEMIGQEFS